MKKVVIVGGGHNGLVCAFKLARAGMKVSVIERRGMVGGACVTEEFIPGYRNSTASYNVGLLSPKVLKEMDLSRHGLRIMPRTGAHFMPLSESSYLQIHYDANETRKSLLATSTPQDADNYKRYNKELEPLVSLIQSLIHVPQPSLPVTLRQVPDLYTMLKEAAKLLKNPKDIELLHRLLTRSIGSILDENFAGDALKGMLSFDAITGAYQSLYDAGNGYVLLHHIMGSTFGEDGRWGHAIGGMGAITEAMRKACVEAGVEVILNTAATEVTVNKNSNAVRGVKTKDTQTGREAFLEADIVASNVHPQHLILDLVPSDIGTDAFDHYRKGVKRYTSGSGTLRMTVALSELPDFLCKPKQTPDDLQYHSSIIIAPSVPYVEKAYWDSKRQGYAESPAIEMMIPSVFDRSLAVNGHHVASLFCQHYDPSLGEKWDALREVAADRVIDTVTKLAPNFRKSIIGKLVLTPWDLQNRFGLVHGDIFHGHLSLAQILLARPVLGFGRYATPIEHLYLCGSGAHPGGGVTGLPGWLSAHEIIALEKRS